MIKIYPSYDITACVGCIAFSFGEWVFDNWEMRCTHLDKKLPQDFDPKKIYELCPLETKEQPK